MFSLKLRPVLHICDSFIIRHFRGNRAVIRGSPGLKNRLKAFQESGLDIEKDDAEEFIESSESDFSAAGLLYDEHLKATYKQKQDLQRHIVKDKYFSERTPNLLTWSEKEQIRHLVSHDPDKWTLEKISESFPVTPEVVKKLVKYPWKPATQERIARHDSSVLRNWRALKEGSLEISPNLKNHFLKFADRTIPPLDKKSMKIDITRERKMGEFESIIRKCANEEHKDNVQHKESNTNKRTDKFTYKTNKTKRLTLSELTDKIQKGLDSGNPIDINDEIIIRNIHGHEPNVSTIKFENDIELQSYSKAEGDVTEHKSESETENNVMNYPDRIRIPRKSYKKGATYKVNDCFYDHDGIFLYRVLGM